MAIRSRDYRHVRMSEQVDGSKCYQAGGKKMSFWLNRAQTRLADLAVVSYGIQAHPPPDFCSSFYLLFDNSSALPLRWPVYCQQLEF